MTTTVYDLPEPVDGLTALWNTPEWQLRRLNRIASALWKAKELLGDSPYVSVSVRPDSGLEQISIHVHTPAGRDVAEALVARLGWDPEPTRRRVGMNRHFGWAGMLGGFRATAVWVEVPESGDSQGREQLPADVGVGNAAADAEHVRLQQLAGAASGFEVIDHPGIGSEVVFTSNQPPSQALASTRPGFNPIKAVIYSDGPGQ